MSDKNDTTKSPDLIELPTGLLVVRETTQYKAPEALAIDDIPITLYPGVYRIHSEYRFIFKFCDIADWIEDDEKR